MTATQPLPVKYGSLRDISGLNHVTAGGGCTKTLLQDH